MLNKIQAIVKLKRLIFDSVFQNATHGTIKVADNEVLLDTNGSIKMITIQYSGNIYIYNKLPDGYSITANKKTIRIINLVGRNLPESGLLFNFDGDINITKAKAITFNGNRFSLNKEDVNKLSLIDQSKTNLEDDTLLILDEEDTNINPRYNKTMIDDDTIRGSYTNKQFKNGYSGYYNYSPSRKSFATGRELTNNSTAIGNKTGFAKNIMKKQITQPVITTQKAPEVKPLKTKKKEPIKRSKY